MPLPFKHLTSTKQLSREDTDSILKVCEKMEKVRAKGGSNLLRGKILANLFYEPSTRTNLSFATAMHKLGGKVITAVGMQFSSLYKGETIEDTMQVIGQYADVIAMRHPEKGSADIAASACPVPFINAGDGPNQHPTQGLLDMLTIKKERGKLDGIHLTAVGDLKFGRTIHSVSFLLGLYDNVKITLVSPKELLMPEKVTSFFKEKGIEYTETENLEDGLDADIIYMTRVQEERFENKDDFERLKLKYILKPEHVKDRDITVMHPLPRIGEIDTGVDELPNAAYFREVNNGVTLRMALLAMLLGKA